MDIKRLVKPWIETECPQCHNKFSTKDYSQKYCSVVCKETASRKTIRPSKSELKLLLERKTPWLHLGKMFGVSDNAVRKWARKYDLIGS